MTGDLSDRSPEQRLTQAGINLPSPPGAVAMFAPYLRTDTTVHISGQLATSAGALVAVGKLGDEVTLEQGKAAARACAINVLAQLRQAAGGTLDNVATLSKITVYVASDPEFTAQPQVADGASELLRDVLGPHTRAAIGVSALPLDTPVEVDAVAELRP